MVNISPLKPFIPLNPEEFCTNPYDIISKEEQQELKRNSNSVIHLILPDGEGDEVYQNARIAYVNFKENGIIKKEKTPSIFIYQQESVNFKHQGLIVGIHLQDYEDGMIVKHEHVRDKPFKDRTNHIVATKVAAGLVWTVFQVNKNINALFESIKKKEPKFDYKKYGYRHLLWQETNIQTIQKLKELFWNKKLYIADGHHRAASAAEYRKIKLQRSNLNEDVGAPWQYLLAYVASDDQIRILPYNRVIRKLQLSETEFIRKLQNNFKVELIDNAFNPKKKNEIAICLKGKWYKLIIKNKNFKSKIDSLDVTIVQDKILDPILNISDPRSDENIDFIGDIKDPKEREKYLLEKGYDLFISLYPVNIKDLQAIADEGDFMPPKSTWFDPKLLSGLILHDLEEK
ncbi:MAG: DUF1015 domain-containing protein [Promethearchaeota archaeon]